MASAIPATAAPHPNSCCTTAKNYIKSKKTTQTVKASLWYLSAVGSLFIPVPFLNGFLSGSMVFMGGHETAQHPSSICMEEGRRPITLSRTWKHITAGTIISGMGGGVAAIGFTIQMSALIGFGVCAGLGGAFAAAYSDCLFPGDYSREAILAEEERAASFLY